MNYLELFYAPQSFFNQVKLEASFGGALSVLLHSGAVFGFVALFFHYLERPLLFGFVLKTSYFSALFGLGLFLLFYFLFAIVVSFFIFMVMRIVGGVGSYIEVFYLFSFLQLFIAFFFDIFILTFGGDQKLHVMLFAVSFLIITNILLAMIKEVGEFSTTKAVFSVILLYGFSYIPFLIF